MPSRTPVVDANILVRAVLGKYVPEVFETYVVYNAFAKNLRPANIEVAAEQ